jgi:ribosomal-protein-alanine N-acetyltransferase
VGSDTRTAAGARVVTSPDSDEKVAGAVTLRRPTIMDLDAVTAIERASFADPWSAAEFASVLDVDHTIFLVAEAGEKSHIVGYVIAMAVLDQAEILNVAVAPESRGAGLGGGMLDAALLEVERRGAQSVFLEVRVSNAAARALYSSRGFVEISRRKNYYRTPVEDALVMQRAVIG